MNNLNTKFPKNIFLILSIIIHLLIFIIALILGDFGKFDKEPLKYIEITEIIQEPNINNEKAKRLAKNSRKALKETAPKEEINNYKKPSAQSSESQLSKKENKKNDKEEDKPLEKDGYIAKKKKEDKKTEESISSKESIFSPKITDNKVKLNEETVDLDTKEFKYISYFLKIKRKIELVWSYPQEAYSKGYTGKVLVKMSLDKKGKLIDVKVLKSSGYKILDNEATKSIIEASPYAPFPESWEGLDKLNIRVKFAYLTGSWQFR